jgi:polysaccharide deacetylase family protein (PEP-CTERM system associated)
MKCIFSVDVEDWFHILDLPSTPELSEWDSLPSHVEKNFRKLLDIFSEKNVAVTCFFLGWVAQKFPHLVKEASRRGHEIASHGYAHQLVYRMTEGEFFRDAIKSKEILEDIIGRPVLGYRAAGFSTTENTPWFFDALIKAGYRYDSSVFPASRAHGGLKTNQYAPYVVSAHSKRLVEFPITVADVLGTPICFFGGGYLRIFPYVLTEAMTVNVLKENRSVIFYIHPREIDPNHPRLSMPLKRRFKSYVNLKTTEKKIGQLLDKFEFTTFERFIANNTHLPEASDVEAERG